MPGLDPDWQGAGVLVAYSAAVILASVFGGLLPDWIRLTHNKMQLLISFVGGIMLGIAIFHMIPHALVASGGAIDRQDVERVAWGVMLGLLATFFLLRFFQFHQHGPGDFGFQGEEGSEPAHLCSEHTHPSHSHAHGQQSTGKTRWVFVLVGLGLHTLMDGVAMASGVVAESGHHHGIGIPGLGIFLAVLLHKPLDAVSITSLMKPSTTPNQRLLVNVGFALMCPVGAFLFWFGAGLGNEWASSFATWGLAFSAGVFLCISLSDLLPEMEFHSHNRIPLSIALLAGILAAYAIGILEGEDAHGTNASESTSHDDGHVHDHSGHNHD
ncbi:MAG: ZIP family metal transporter [Planctomycetota bacterium]